MELILTLVVFLLAFLGLGIGLVLTGRPPQGSCGALSCLNGARCDGCPRRRAATEAENG